MREIALVERDVLDADDPLVGLELGDAIDEQKRIAVRQDPLDRGVVERQREVHRWSDCQYNPVVPSRFTRALAVHIGATTEAITRESVASSRRLARRGRRSHAAEHELVTTLFDLGRQVTAVLDLDELLQQIPRLIGRLISFEAFAVYLLDERRGELRVAYSVGYPPRETPFRLKLGKGLVGAAVASEQPLLVNDLAADPRYVEFVPGMDSEIVVPLLHKSRPIGALNILSRNRDQFSQRRRRDRCASSRAHVAVALVNARLFEQSRLDAEAFETLAEIGREVASVLDLDELFARIAQLDQARDRLPHVRHPAAQRGRASSR